MENEQKNYTDKNRIFCSIGRHLGLRPKYIDDMKSLYYVMLYFAGVDLPWQHNISNKTEAELIQAKKQYDDIRVSSTNWHHHTIKNNDRFRIFIICLFSFHLHFG